MLNQVLMVSSGTSQQSVEVRSKSVTFLDFWISQGSVATYCRWGGNLCDMYIENLLTNHLVKEFWKSVHICSSYYQTSRDLVFLEYGVYCMCNCEWNYRISSENVLNDRNFGDIKSHVVQNCVHRSPCPTVRTAYQINVSGVCLEIRLLLICFTL